MYSSELRDHIDFLVQDEAPAATLAEGMIEAAENGRWDDLKPVFGNKADGLKSEYLSNPERFIERFRRKADAARKSLKRHSENRLKEASSFSFVGLSELSALEQFQRLMDADNTLLQVAFAYKLVDMIDPATRRAARLSSWVVREPSSTQADKYLQEACECYYFGLYTACAVMCRALLEEVLERKLPGQVLQRWKSELRDGKLTLGFLLSKVNNMSPLPVPVEFPRLARRLNEMGCLAAHQESAKAQDAIHALQLTRMCLMLLLG